MNTIIIIATYVAAALIFFIGRYLLRNKVLIFIAEHKRFAALDAVISGNDAFKLMLLLRLTPLPFAMLSYALSVTEVKFWPYLAATSGILIYNGAIDDKPSTDKSDIPIAKNYVSTALQEAMDGKPVTTPSTPPYGCSVKYKN